MKRGEGWTVQSLIYHWWTLVRTVVGHTRNISAPSDEKAQTRNHTATDSKEQWVQTTQQGPQTMGNTTTLGQVWVMQLSGLGGPSVFIFSPNFIPTWPQKKNPSQLRSQNVVSFSQSACVTSGTINICDLWWQQESTSFTAGSFLHKYMITFILS